MTFRDIRSVTFHDDSFLSTTRGLNGQIFSPKSVTPFYNKTSLRSTVETRISKWLSVVQGAKPWKLSLCRTRDNKFRLFQKLEAFGK
jgi:hypothetical protein